MSAAAPTDADPAALRRAIAALEGQRGLLGDAVAELALAPLRQRLAQFEAAAPQLRRAQVTVLFADIVDSTALAGRLDAEDVLQVFGGILQRAAACVHARGGRVLRYTGDGLKAGFGTQGTREDDAVQAVQAGLDILAAAREHAAWVAREHGVAGFALRVGAHTGEVALGAGFESDNTLTGDTVNVAARLEQAAPPGGFRVSAETWAHARGRFEGQPQPPLTLKGVEQTMVTWLVQAARAGAVARGIEGLQIAMIGRDAERRALDAALATAATGRLQAVTVVADAGLGKTRLLREVLADAAAAGAPLHLVRAQPGAEMRPWGLLHGLLSAHCGISDSDSAETARARLLATLAPEVGADGEARAQQIGQLLGLDFGDVPALRGRDARALRDLAFAALRDWLAALCRAAGGRACVLVFEDLHWADEASLDALQHWTEHAAGLPLALVMSSRPVLLERRPAWGEAPAGQRLVLAPLPDDDRRRLADALLQRIDAPPARLRELLVGRAEGNPFYMEELLRRLLDDGAIRRDGDRWHVDPERLDRVRLPTTLVGLLQARLDALPPAERLAAQRASIVGHVFWDDALATVDAGAPASLDTLRRRQWVRDRANSAFAGTAERQFDHHLLHQVTYDTVLKEERRRGHAAVARWLAQRTEGRAPEFLAITAEHAERAGETALALDGYERAAGEAERRFANTLAIDCLRKAIRLTDPDDATRLDRLLDRLYTLLDVVGDRAGQADANVQRSALLARHPDAAAEARLRMNEAMLADRLGDTGRAHPLATQALQLAVQTGQWGLAAYAHLELCWLRRGDDDPQAAREHLAAARQCAARVQHSEPLRAIQVLQLSGILEADAGRPHEAAAHLLEALDTAEATGHRRSMLGTLDHLTTVGMSLGEAERSLHDADRMLVLARELGDLRGTTNAHRHRAVALSGLGRDQEAHDVLVPLVESAWQRGDRTSARMLETVLGWALEHLGEHRASRDAYARALQLLEQDSPGSTKTLEGLAAVCTQELALGHHDVARAGLDKILAAVAAGTQAQAVERDFWLQYEVGVLLTGLGDPGAAAWIAAAQRRVRETAAALARPPQTAEDLMRRVPEYRYVMSLDADPGA